MKIFPIGLLLAVATFGQPFGAGIKVGTSLGSSISLTSLQGAASSVSTAALGLPSDHNLIVGPYAELRLPLHVALEGDFLYEKGLFDALLPGLSTARYQIPIIAKYRFGSGKTFRPFVGGGALFTKISGLTQLKSLNHSADVGGTLAAGIDMKLLFLHLAPEIRYNATALQDIADPIGLYKSKRGTAYFLLAFGF